MAVADRIDSRLKLAFEDGVDFESGETIIKNKTFNNIKMDSTADALLAVTQALVPLQQKTLYRITRNDTELITKE